MWGISGLEFDTKILRDTADIIEEGLFDIKLHYNN